MKFGSTVFLTGICVFLSAQAPEPAAMAQRYQASLARVKAWQVQAADLHPAFAKTHPVALVVDGQFYVFEAAADGKGWNLSAQAPVKFPIPAGIRAAMPLDFWNNRIACVVSPEVFASPEGYAVILHEFVHCYQWETVEGNLKQGLAVNREAMARGDYMWELRHPFPYGNAEVRRVYGLWQDALQKGRLKKARHWRSVLKKGLNSRDWEYMAWQEWKEGLARYLENLVRIRFGLQANRPAPDAPFNRISFYRGGDLFIMRLQESEPGLDKDLGRLFQRIFASGG
jgi:hypothetical protein